MGYTEKGTLVSWLPVDADEEIYFSGGVMGPYADAVAIVATNERLKNLLDQYEARMSGRPEAARDEVQDLYRYIPNSLTNDKEITMSHENEDGFKSIDYFNGYPIADLSDKAIFDTIAREQDKLKELEKLPEGAAVSAHRKRLQSGIDKLIAAVNARYPDE